MGRESRRLPGRERRRLARGAIASAVAALACLAMWLSRPDALPIPLPVVGYPTFHDFDYGPMLLLLRLTVWWGPAIWVAVYLGLRRWGRSLAEPRDHPRPAPVSGIDSDRDRTPGSRRGPAPSVWSRPEVTTARRIGRTVPPAAVVALAVSSWPDVPGQRVSWAGLLGALAYVLGVLAAGRLLSRDERTAGRWSADEATSASNAVAGPLAAVASLTLFTARTATVSDSGSVQRWAWLPWWASLALALGVLAWVWHARRTRRSWPTVERWGTGLFVASIALFMVTSSLPGPIGRLEGFDDMMSATGGELLVSGEMPWRDFLFIHGLWDDSLRSAAGFWLFQDTLWGSYAVVAALWVPLSWVGVYLLGVWASRGRWMPIGVILVLIVWTDPFIGFLPRWIAAAFVLVLLGEALRRDSRRWTAAMTVALFVQAVLVPEAAFQVIAVTVVLVAHDLATRQGPVRGRLRHTAAFAATGAICTAGLAAALGAFGALTAFVRYYLVFGPSHVASGALPAIGQQSYWFFRIAYVVAVVAVAVTLTAVVLRLLTRRRMPPHDWVLLSAALLAALYTVKGIARADNPHLAQSVSVAFLVAVLLVPRLLPLAVRAARSARHAGAARRALVVVPLGVLTGVVVVSALPVAASSVMAVPTLNKQVVGAERAGIGFTATGTTSTATLDDLGAMLDAYGEGRREVADLTNSPGYFYYLLGGHSPTSYYHVSMAIPEIAQRALVDELRTARPALVAFDSQRFGLPAWDGVHNMVRHFEVSQYVLDHWTPIARVRGVLFLLRDDLVSGRPDLPDLRESAETDRLTSMPQPCDWGYAAAYLPSEPTGEQVSLRADSRRSVSEVLVSGWAYDLGAGQQVDRVVVAIGNEVVASGSAQIQRPDVAEGFGVEDAVTSGFQITSTTTLRGPVRVYAVLADGLAHPVAEPTAKPSRLREAGQSIRVSPEAVAGGVDTSTTTDVDASVFTLPDDVDPVDYQVATLVSGGADLGRGDYVISGRQDGSAGAIPAVHLQTVDRTGSSIDVRVGSCLPWHGIDGGELVVLNRSGRRVEELRLGRLPAH